MQDKELNDQILELIFSVGRLMKGEMKFNSSAANLSLLQIQTLMFIQKHGEVQMKDLASNFTITLPTATSLVDNLIKAGLVLRTRSTEDRRVVTIKLSAQGKKLFAKIARERTEKMNTMLSYISHKERKDLFKVLTSLKKNLEREHEK
jgi:DNA-binding MarR family transcriptional regulator